QKPVLPPPPPRFRFTYEERPYERVLHADKFDLTAGGKTLLKGAEFTLMRGEKCALLGENGTGKSTLLKYFLSKNPAVQLSRFVKIAYYDQENADLDGEERVLEAFWGKYSLLSQTDARKLLAQAGLDADDVNKKVKELSGGLKAKLELSLLQARRGNVLFLDEPTNHLDLPAREALEEALKEFDGTVLFVSHDRRFTEAIATRIACLEDGKIVLFNGGYEEYLQSKKDVKKEAPQKQEQPKERDGGYRSRQERAKETQKRTRIREIENRLEALEAEEEELNSELVANAADYTAVQKITARLNDLHAESDSLYEEYETLI
ncbi:MAG: ATP-binding cassette domain-containing protein, partial [Clostridia bacterium]|nr:ATP-binding cassette domain-containing protein [Clostridia bacterium]